MDKSKELQLLRGLYGHLMDDGRTVWADLIEARIAELVKDEPVSLTQARHDWDMLVDVLMMAKSDLQSCGRHVLTPTLRECRHRLEERLEAQAS